MSELQIDNSKEVFKLDKECLKFKLNTDNLSEIISSDLPKSENEIKVTNLTDDYLAFRTKTTKKFYYSIKPTHCIIPPKQEINISIVFSAKQGEKVNLHGHKFKFEGFIISEEEKDKEAKDLFNEYTQKGTTVVGSTQKTFVLFSDNNEHEYTSSKKSSKHLQIPTSHERTPSDLSEYGVIDEKDENEDANENKGLLMDKIQSNEDQKKTLSDMIKEIPIEEKEEENKEDENKEEVKKDENINKEPEKENNLNENKILSEIISEPPKTEKKIEESSNDNNLSEKINQNVFENKSNAILEDEDNEEEEEGRKNVHDILWFSALFISMLIGYYIVK